LNLLFPMRRLTMPRGKDGTIIGDATAVSVDSASGIWTMSEVHKYKTEGTWPVPTYATGGTESAYTGFRVHTFLITETGENFTANVAMNVDILVVAGGGEGGNNDGGGGGGAGGFKYWSQKAITAGDYEITVGIGGVAVAGDPGVNGGNSVFEGLSASTGGGGGGSWNSTDAGDGGSGGGGTGRENSPGGDGSSNQGNNGGNSCPATSGGTTDTGGGGGGASAVGTTGANNGPGGNGGAGITEGATGIYNWTTAGTVTFPAAFKVGAGGNLSYAGGGAGGSETGTAGTAGLGGGGAAVRGAADATAHTGGGGGGNHGSPAGFQGSGGTGIVIIRYAI
jgi:hypothetical protein